MGNDIFSEPFNRPHDFGMRRAAGMGVLQPQQETGTDGRFALAFKFGDASLGRTGNDAGLPDALELEIVLLREFVKGVGAVPPIVFVRAHQTGGRRRGRHPPGCRRPKRHVS